MNGLSTGWVSVGKELAELELSGRELALLEMLEGLAELDDNEELDGSELKLELDVRKTLDELLLQTVGTDAQNSLLQVSGGQSG